MMPVSRIRIGHRQDLTEITSLALEDASYLTHELTRSKSPFPSKNIFLGSWP